MDEWYQAVTSQDSETLHLSHHLQFLPRLSSLSIEHPNCLERSTHLLQKLAAPVPRRQGAAAPILDYTHSGGPQRESCARCRDHLCTDK